MSELQFPKDPVVGQQYDFPPYRYYWDGVKWKTIGVGYNPVNDLRDELEPRIDELEDDVTQLQSGNSSLVQAVNSLNVRVTAEEKDTKDWEGFTAELLAQGGVPDDGHPDEIGNSKRVEAINAISAKRYATIFKNEFGYSAVENMVAGRINGKAGVVAHKAGNVYSTGGTTWECMVYGASGIDDFTPLTSVSVKDFGAKGDGATDDAKAIRTAFSLSGATVYIPSGRYLISSIINATGSNIRIIGHGDLKVGTNDNITTLCTVSGDNVIVDGLRIDGSSKVGVAVLVVGNNTIIKNCVVENLYGTTTNGCAFHFEGDIEFVASGNIVRNVDAVDNNTIGDAVGACRAFLVSHNAHRDKHGIIEDNIIETVIGEEGDAIQVLCNAGSLPYANGNVTIKRNYIKNCNRRAIKIQASACIITDNEHVNTLPDWQVLDPSSLINIIVGNHNIVSNNKVSAGSKLNGIYVAGVSGTLITGNIITNNTIICELSGDSVTGREGIYLDYLDGFVCDGNNIVNGNSFAIGSGNVSRGSICNNKISGSGSSGKPAINITSGGSKIVISGNVNLSGTRSDFIRCGAANSVIRDNHNFSANTSNNIRAAASAVATLIDGNTNVNGLAVYGTATDLKSAYLGPGNRGLGFGSSAPGVAFVVDHPHEHANLYWTRGDIAWNVNQGGAVTLGWRCTGSGVGAASTWRTIPDNI